MLNRNISLILIVLSLFILIGSVSANDSIANDTMIANESIASGSIGSESPIANELQNMFQEYRDPIYISKQKTLVHDDTQPLNQIDDPIKSYHIPESYCRNHNLTKYGYNIHKNISYELAKYPFEPTISFQPIIFHKLSFNGLGNSNNNPDQPNLSIIHSFKEYNLGNSNNNPIILDNKTMDVKHSYKNNYSQIEVHIYNQKFYDNHSYLLRVQVDDQTDYTYSLYNNTCPYQTGKVEYQPLKPGKHNISVCLEKTALQICKGYDMYHNLDFNVKDIPIDPEYTWQLNTTFTIPPE